MIPSVAEAGRRIAAQLDTEAFEALVYYLFAIQRKLKAGQHEVAASKLETLEKALSPQSLGGG